MGDFFGSVSTTNKVDITETGRQAMTSTLGETQCFVNRFLKDNVITQLCKVYSLAKLAHLSRTWLLIVCQLCNISNGKGSHALTELSNTGAQPFGTYLIWYQLSHEECQHAKAASLNQRRNLWMAYFIIKMDKLFEWLTLL